MLAYAAAIGIPFHPLGEISLTSETEGLKKLCGAGGCWMGFDCITFTYTLKLKTTSCYLIYRAIYKLYTISRVVADKRALVFVFLASV